MPKNEITKTKTDKSNEAIADLVKILGGEIAEDVETTEWVSTGIKALNFFLSGDVDKGIPAGKMIIVAGEQQSGKSFLGARFAAHAQKQGYIPIWLDSEHASDKRFLARQGLNVNLVPFRRPDTVEEFQSIVIKALNQAKEKGLKLFIVLDSLGALSGAKETADADADKMTMDMGLRAKNIRTVFKQIIHRMGETGSIFYCINHIFISPGFIPKKEMGGGLAAWYLGQIVLFLTKLKGEDGVFSIVKMKSKKNREFIEGRTIQFEINFQKGVDPNAGLIDLFEEFGVIKKVGAWYKLDGDEKSYREETILNDKEILDKLLVVFKEKTANYSYSSFIPEN
jgi:RecA/RadA recombinase